MNKTVTIIVPTINSAQTLRACLASIAHQSYTNIELIVIDKFSTDGTSDIAKEYTPHVYSFGPERCAQRNEGARRATGDYVLFIDCDMELSPEVVRECVTEVESRKSITSIKSIVGVIIPEESFGEGFWAECKKLERSFYVGVAWMEAARFFPKKVFDAVGGYDEQLVSGEDWDLSQRVAATGSIARIPSFICHNEGHLRLSKTIKKKFHYARMFARYIAKREHTPVTQKQTGIFARYGLFFREPIKLFASPLHGIGMLFMKTCEFAAGGIGIGYARLLERDKPIA